MNLRLTGALLAVAIILGGVVYYLMQQPSPTEQTAKAKTPQIFSVPPTTLAKLTMSSAGKTTVVEQQNNHWQVTSPVTSPADEARVGVFAFQVSSLSAQDTIDNAADLAQYGLAPPKSNLVVNTTDGKTYELNVGNPTVDGRGYYARQPSQNTVYLISSTLVSQVAAMAASPPVATPTPTPAASPGAAPVIPGATPAALSPAAVPAIPIVSPPAVAPSGTPGG